MSQTCAQLKSCTVLCKPTPCDMCGCRAVGDPGEALPEQTALQVMWERGINARQVSPVSHSALLLSSAWPLGFSQGSLGVCAARGHSAAGRLFGFQLLSLGHGRWFRLCLMVVDLISGWRGYLSLMVWQSFQVCKHSLLWPPALSTLWSHCRNVTVGP